MQDCIQLEYTCLTNDFFHRDSLIVGLVDGATSFYSGLVIFSILGFMAHEKGVSVADVATGGELYIILHQSSTHVLVWY